MLEKKVKFTFGMKVGSVQKTTLSLWKRQQDGSVDQAPSSDTVLADLIAIKKVDLIVM